MAKACDRVEWRFIGQVMWRMGFAPLFISWIMICITLVSFSFLVNGSLYELIMPTRGTKQGDPLSPYLLLIITEGLSHLIRKIVLQEELEGMRISNPRPRVTHLLFAGGSPLFFVELMCSRSSVLKGFSLNIRFVQGKRST